MDPYGYVLGCVLTDASMFTSRFKIRTKYADGSPRERETVQYRIALQCKDRAFADRFADALEELIGRPVKRSPFTRTIKRSTLTGLQDGYVFNGFHVKVAARPLWEKLARGREISALLCLPRDVLLSVLSAVVDADGYVAVNGDIIIRQKEPQWILDLCRRLGVPNRHYNYPTQTAAQVEIRRDDAAGVIDTFKRPKKKAAA